MLAIVILGTDVPHTRPLFVAAPPLQVPVGISATRRRHHIPAALTRTSSRPRLQVGGAGNDLSAALRH